MRCLIINMDNQLLEILSWKNAVQLLLEEKLIVLSSYNKVARSQHLTIDLPAVAMLKEYKQVKKRKHIFSKPTKKNLLIRDNFSCQYCGVKLTYGTATIDHIIPKHKNGQHTMLNTVASCKRCNNAKDNMWLEEFTKKTGLSLRRQPRHLNEEEKLHCILKSFKSKEKKIWIKTLKEHNIELW